MEKCYALVSIDVETLKVVNVGLYSESALVITHRFGIAMAELFCTEGETFQDALDKAQASIDVVPTRKWIRQFVTKD